MVTYWRNLGPLRAKYRWWALVSFLLILKCRATNMESVDETASIECPVISENSACPCYKFEDGESMSALIGNKFISIQSSWLKLEGSLVKSNWIEINYSLELGMHRFQKKIWRSLEVCLSNSSRWIELNDNSDSRAFLIKVASKAPRANY